MEGVPLGDRYTGQEGEMVHLLNCEKKNSLSACIVIFPTLQYPVSKLFLLFTRAQELARAYGEEGDNQTSLFYDGHMCFASLLGGDRYTGRKLGQSGPKNAKHIPFKTRQVSPLTADPSQCN